MISIRLDPATERRANALRARGVVISRLVRAAINAEYERLRGKRTESRVEILDRLHAQSPPAPEHAARGYDVSKRPEAAAAIRAHLAKKHPR